nr:TRIC cation channel family protein [Paraflavitalea speifideiaquila]
MEYNFLNIIDILGTIAFAASGAFSAMERKLDPLVWLSWHLQRL